MLFRKLYIDLLSPEFIQWFIFLFFYLFYKPKHGEGKDNENISRQRFIVLEFCRDFLERDFPENDRGGFGWGGSWEFLNLRFHADHPVQAGWPPTERA